MRTYLLMFLMLAAAAGGFALYLHLQGPLRSAPIEQASAGGQSFDLSAEHEGDLGPGQRPWIRVLDSMRRLQYRFGADDYTPNGGHWDVRGVEAHFFQYVDESKDPSAPKYRTQQIRIHGKTGQIEMQQPVQANANGFDKGSSGPPKRGLLNDVTIYVISRWTPELEKRLRNEPGAEQALANITATMPNIAFDNETFEITTHEYTDADGTFVPADEVPVHATGDYEFNGKGMTLRWNQVDGRLEYLEVAHGNYLVVRDAEMLGKTAPAGFGAGNGGPATRPSQPPTADAFGVTPLLDPQGRPIQFAAAGRSAAAPAPVPGKASPPHKKQKGPQPPYRATFDQNVTILQGEPEVSEEQVAQADLMHVEFLPGNKNPTTRPATQPSTKSPAVAAPAPATAPTAQRNGDAHPATAPASPPALASAKSPQSRPSTRPAGDVPLIIRWTGKLRVVPIDEPGDVPPALKPGESIVHLIGSKAPVQLTREAMHAWCTVADYFSTDGSAQLSSSKEYGPVRLRQIGDASAKGGMQQADIVTQQLNYSGTDRVAILHGESTAHILLPQQPATRPSTQPSAGGATTVAMTTPKTQPATQPVVQTMVASWTREGRLHFQPAATGAAMTFDHAELEGDVDVKHPQMALRSQKLDLYFEEKPATRPTTHPAAAPATAPASQPATRPASTSVLKKVVAVERVWCDLTGSNGQRQTVTTDRLTMTTAQDSDGKLYPQFITADGKAHAYDGQQDLKAGHLELTLVPATRPTTRPSTADTAVAGGMDTTSVELKEMRAWNRVAVRNAEGSTAVGNWMEVHVVDGQPIARIIGSPLAAATTDGWLGRRIDPIARMAGAPLASVTDPKGSRATGPIIDFDPRRQWAKVTGRGTIRAIQDEPAKPTTQPTTRGTTPPHPATQPTTPKFADIFWEREAELDGAKNRIIVSGPVLITSTEPDGTRQTATGRRAVIDLIDRPATQPTTKPTTRPAARPAGQTPVAGGSTPAKAVSPSASRPTTRVARSTTRPADGGATGIAGGGMDVLKDKVVSAFNLEKDAVVNSTLADATGILRQVEIRSDVLRYETGETATSAATRPAGTSAMAIGASGTGRLIAPGPGTMIHRDHTPPTTRPADGQANQPEQSRRATAFRWSKNMMFDQAQRRADMKGDVLIVHQDDQPDAEPVRVSGDHVVALFEPKPPAPTTAPRAAGQPARPGVSAPPAIARAGQPVTPAPARPATRSAESPDQSMQLRWLTITGSVMMNRAGSTLTADRADYNPASGWLVAVGTRQMPATFSNADGSDITWADQIHWNTQNWTAKFFGLRGRASSGDKGPEQPGQMKKK